MEQGKAPRPQGLLGKGPKPWVWVSGVLGEGNPSPEGSRSWGAWAWESMCPTQAPQEPGALHLGAGPPVAWLWLRTCGGWGRPLSAGSTVPRALEYDIVLRYEIQVGGKVVGGAGQLCDC